MSATFDRFQNMDRYPATSIEYQSEQVPPGKLTDVNAIFLNMSPIMTMTGKFDDGKELQASESVNLDDIVPSPLPESVNEDLYLSCSPQDFGWTNYLELDIDSDPLEDVFTASKGAIVDGPTLAALNGDSETLDDLDLENLPLPDKNMSLIRGSNVPTPTREVAASDCLNLNLGSATSNQTANSNVADEGATGGGGDDDDDTTATVTAPKCESEEIASPKSTLHELLIRCRSATIASSRPSQHPSLGVLTVHQAKMKREPLLSSFASSFCETLKRRSSAAADCLRSSSPDTVMRSFSQTCGSLSSLDSAVDEAHQVPLMRVSTKDDTTTDEGDSHDEGFDSEDLDDSDNCDYSDADSENSWQAGGCDSSSASLKSRKKECYFWQYNLQAKGPKGTRLPFSSDSLDPHMLDEVTDPVFSPCCQVKGIKHTGKARRGDGNDLNPSPIKLHQIGQELKKLNKVINDLTPVSELPFNVRPKSRKEKNKLASRACRLKKKAQHEANKLKLYGLEHEHKRLMYVLSEVKKLVALQTNGQTDRRPDKLSEHLDRLSKTFLKTKVAGHAAEFVNGVLDKVATGHQTGGLEQL